MRIAVTVLLLLAADDAAACRGPRLTVAPAPLAATAAPAAAVVAWAFVIYARCLTAHF